MRIVLFLLLVLCIHAASGQSSTIEAQIKNLGNDTVFVELNALSKTPDIDTVLASNGHFTYTRKIDQATVTIIEFKKTALWNTPANRSYFPSSKQIRIILLPDDHSRIEGQLSSQGIRYTIQGNELNEALAAFEQKNLDERVGQEKAFRKVDSLFRIGKPGEAGPFGRQMGELQQRIHERRQEYIDHHLDSDLSAYLVACSGDPETFGNSFIKLDDKVRNGLLRNLLEEKNALYRAYVKAKEINPGAHAENFSLADIDGNTFTLSDRKGKYILLDFWGSWCMPCIKGIPALKEYQAKYKDKVEFISIACLDSQKKWKAAVKKYDLQWTQLFNDASPERNTCIKYGVSAFPTKILVDPDGNIVSIHSGESKAFYEEMDRRFGR